MLSVTHKVRIIAVLTILAALCVYPVRAATPYTVDDLGTLGGGYSWPYFINEAGQVVGVSDGHAFVWGNGMMTDLGTLGGGYSYPYVANEAGEVAGVSQTASGEEHAFLWKGGALIDLGTLGGSSSSPAGINEAGEIIGYGLNWVPGALEPGLMARYASIEDAAATLGLREVYVPSYFPESLGWPPAEILAQSRPYQAVVMRFVRARDGQTGLVISQAMSADFEPDVQVRIRTVREVVPIDLGGRRAQLEAGTCEDGSVCSRIRWDEGEVRIVLTMQAPPIELVRIAQSMRH